MVIFTPATALVGGLVLGTAAAGKLVLTGRVLGISGALKYAIVAEASASGAYESSSCLMIRFQAFDAVYALQLLLLDAA
jgi:hypothetical protein